MLLFAIGPLTEALQVNVLHATCALTWCNEWVPTADVLFLVEANSANLARLVGPLNSIRRSILHQWHA